MSVYHLIEIAVVAAVVGVAARAAVRAYAPGVMRAIRGGGKTSEGRAETGAGCGSGCSSCGSCDSGPRKVDIS